MSLRPLRTIQTNFLLDMLLGYRNLKKQNWWKISTGSRSSSIPLSIHIRQHFGAQAKIWLFGSRVDDHKRGGDVDLYVEADYAELLPELRCKINLEEALDLHVDLIVGKPG